MIREVNRAAKIGERIRITKNISITHEVYMNFEAGEEYTVEGINLNGLATVLTKNHGLVALLEREYVVLEGYKPTPSEVTIEIKKKDVEDAIYGLQLLKPMVQARVIKGNGSDTKQAKIDVEECGKHFDIAIIAMTMLLSGFEEEKTNGTKRKG